MIALQEGKTAEAMKAFKSALYFFPGYRPARELLNQSRRQPGQGVEKWNVPQDFVFNETLEIFSEVTSIALEDE